MFMYYLFLQNVNEESSLSERQISILESNGLPTNPDELTIKQKNTINSIEKGFRYLDEKILTSNLILFLLDRLV